MSASCSGRDSPTSAAATFGFCSTQAIASCGIVAPACSAIGLSFCTAVRMSSFRKPLMKSGPRCAGRSRASRPARAALAGTFR